MSVNLKELAQMSQPLKLLYVEDDTNARESTYQLLTNYFHEVVTAVDGKDGLEKFNKQKFDLILSDINMPRLSGIEMLKVIREKNSNIPVLLLSAYDDSDYFLHAIELDVDGYILKPLMMNQLSKTLFKVVQKINLLALKENYQKKLEAEVKKRNVEIEYKLYYDTLTKLLSRYSFFKDISKLYAPVILLIDIDKFKLINEVYGSNVGTEVLKEFAKTLSQVLPKNNEYKLYRLSADEFAILDSTRHIEPEKYELLIATLFKHLNNLKITIGENTISIDITIGLSTVEKNGYESAKIALDYAKQHKKPYVMYSSQIDHRKESSLTLKCRDDISAAIDEERVVAVYQPIVNKEGKTVKHETLMRLQEKDSYSLMSPFYFLDVAIKTRLYEHLSSTIIFKALDLLRRSEHVLSINFTYSDIKNKSFVKKIETYLTQYPEIGERTVFEITESESIEDYADVKSFIQGFRKFGVRFAIDDFGTGFSNFEYILEIEPDYLKIDGSLVKKIDTDEKSYILVQAIVKFSHKLGIKVIAEYVCSETIFLMLKELDVDEYQGFYFSEPLENIEASK